MTFGLSPLIATGVVVSTAATDAVYVMFNAAVTARSPAKARQCRRKPRQCLLSRRRVRIHLAPSTSPSPFTNRVRMVEIRANGPISHGSWQRRTCVANC